MDSMNDNANEGSSIGVRQNDKPCPVAVEHVRSNLLEAAGILGLKGDDEAEFNSLLSLQKFAHAHHFLCTVRHRTVPSNIWAVDQKRAEEASKDGFNGAVGRAWLSIHGQDLHHDLWEELELGHYAKQKTSTKNGK
jgi:hypothetical protein